jgi:hypothetical protein
LAAKLDAQEREKRHLLKVDLHLQKASLNAIEAEMKALSEIADLVARASLLGSGFHQHKRGEWRRRHVRREK